MAGGFKFQPQGVDAMVATIRDLQAQIDSLRQAITGIGINVDATTGNLIVGNGKSLTVKDGGGFSVVDPNTGHTVLYVGSTGFSDGSGRTQAVVEMFRADDGSPALLLRDLGTVPGHTFRQPWQVADRSGNIVLADDDTGHGLALPYLQIPFKQLGPAQMSGTTSATFFPVEWAYHTRLGPRFSACVLLYSPDGATTGEARITESNDGAQIGPTMTIAGSAYGSTTIGPVAWPSWSYKDKVTLALEVRRTAGTGTVCAAVVGAQSEQG